MKIQRRPGTISPEEYDYAKQFNALCITEVYAPMEIGKVLGLAIAYQESKEQIEELADLLILIEDSHIAWNDEIDKAIKKVRG